MKIAAISDIHGNLPALDAVLADIKTSAPDLIVNLGDVLSGPLFPAECADRLLPMDILTISGNHERQLLSLARGEMGDSDRYTACSLRPRHLDWIARFPDSATLEDDILLVHGTPGSDTAYFLETVVPSGAREASVSEIEARADGTSAALILCGHTHIARIRQIGQLTIINPGSVGMPAYAGSTPFRHVMESGSPHARYTILDNTSGVWEAEFKSVVYDWERSAVAAEERGRHDWARALRTGSV